MDAINAYAQTMYKNTAQSSNVKDNKMPATANNSSAKNVGGFVPSEGLSFANNKLGTDSVALSQHEDNDSSEDFLKLGSFKNNYTNVRNDSKTESNEVDKTKNNVEKSGQSIGAEVGPESGKLGGITTGFGKLSDAFSRGKDKVSKMLAEGTDKASDYVSTSKLGEILKMPITFKGTDNDDNVKVSQSEDGTLKVNLNGQESTFTKEQAERLVFNLGKGDDIFTAATSVKSDLRVNGEAGNDYIQGGKGNDTIDGGEGNDVIYGLDGNDILSGGAGNDYIDGGKGNDKIDGGAGKDILAGGKGIDSITGGAGADVLIDDMAIKGASSEDKVYTASSTSASWGKNIQINGDETFRARVESDLETLRALPNGQKMMTEIEKAGHPVKIVPMPDDEPNGSAIADDFDKSYYDLFNNKPGEGTGTTIEYNPSFIHEASKRGLSDDDYPPMGVLFHEMSHAYNNATGTMYPPTAKFVSGGGGGFGMSIPTGVPPAMTKNKDGEFYSENGGELQAVGLPVHMGVNPMPLFDNPPELTENGIRSTLGLAPRERYAPPPTPPPEVNIGGILGGVFGR